MTLHDSGYKHWEGQHLGIWSRRAVIAVTGLKSCLQVKWMRYVVTLCWALAMAQVAVLFALGQLLVSDSAVVRWLGNLNPQFQTIGRVLTTWLEQHPEVSVRATYDALFFLFAAPLSTFTLIAIALAIPHLITRDLSSNAMIVYASKAVGRFDYILGKFGTLFGLMLLTWLGPVLAAWLLGNFLSPNWGFFWHSRLALGHSLLFVGVSMVVLGILGLGVSASSGRARSTVSMWIALWLLGNGLVPIALQTKPWLKFLSFKFNLDQIALAIFKLKNDLTVLQDNLPFLRDMMERRIDQAGWQEPDIGGAILGLAVMLSIALVILLRKARPQ